MDRYYRYSDKHLLLVECSCFPSDAVIIDHGRQFPTLATRWHACSFLPHPSRARIRNNVQEMESYLFVGHSAAPFACILIYTPQQSPD